ncbi:MAG: hypothetical protein AAF438_09435 [Pseudomonadota bacterium]
MPEVASEESADELSVGVDWSSQGRSFSFPKSKWFQTDNKRSRSIIQQQNCDVVVPPMRADKFDFVTRALFSKVTSLQLAQRTDLRVADPTLIEYALNGDQDIPTDDDILQVASLCSAKFIVIADATIPKKNQLRMTVRVKDGRGSILFAEVFEHGFDHDKLPFENFSKVAGSIIHGLKRRSSTPSQDVKFTATVPRNFSESIRLTEHSVVDAAIQLQFLGSLHNGPIYSRAREDLYERALALTDLFPVGQELRGLIRARSLAHLNRRPAALNALKGQTSKPAKALRAFLNGNLTDLDEDLLSIDQPVLSLLAEVERAYLHAGYGLAPEEERTQQLASEHESWALPIYQSMLGQYPWANISNAYVKLWLDMTLPVSGRDLESLLGAKDSAGDHPEESDYVRWGMEHINEALSVNHVEWLARRKQFLGVYETDLIRLGEHLMFANVMQIIKRDSDLRSLPDAANKSVLEFEPYYIDHPVFSLKKGWIQLGVSEGLQGPARDQMRAEAWRTLRSAAYWARHQRTKARMSNFGLSLMDDNGSFKGDDRYEDLLTFPPRTDRWLIARQADRRQSLLDCINYTITNFQCLRELGSDQEVVANNDHRFSGHQARFGFLVEQKRKAGDFEGWETMLSKAIKKGSDDWYPYVELGVTESKRGNPTLAKEIFLEYPGFTSGEVPRLQLVMHAATAAGRLFWVGAVDEAKSIYSLAASYGTGSESEYQSQFRLALMEGRLEDAQFVAQKRVKRYGGAYAYRDLMLIKQLLGSHDEVRSIFDSIVRMNQPQSWTGLLAARGAQDEEDLMAWIAEPFRMNAKTQYTHVALAPRFAFIWYTLDRKLTDDLPKIIQDLHPGPIPKLVGNRVHVGNAPPPPRVGETYPDAELLLVLAAKGLKDIRDKDYEGAYSNFEKAASMYRLTDFRPYYAWSAVKSGKEDEFKKYAAGFERSNELNRKNAPSRTIGALFDHNLSQAFLSGANRDFNESMKYLKLAAFDRPYLNERNVVPMYQVIEAAELLYDDSGHQPYRDLALDLARKYRQIQPMYAWAHATVALYSADDAEKYDALTKAIFLDKNSRRAALVDKSIYQRAARAAAKSNPFLIREKVAELEDT